MPRPTRSLEASFTGVVIGVDEAGCGPLAGPVVAAAVILNPHRHPPGLNDSKKLPPEERDQLYDKIMARAHCAVAVATVAEIDRLNILQARLLAMHRAVDQLNITPAMVLVDGNRAPRWHYATQTVIEGDALCSCIAAASIIAKVTRDRLMRELAAECPGYGWERNAGYGTAEHQQALSRLGVTPHHRRSFAPVKAIVEPDLFTV